MATAFNLGTMLGTSPANTENQVKQIPCDMLEPYHNHKFKLYSGERLEDMVQSIKDNGVLIPIIVQPLGYKYEILIGHNRWNASKLAGLPTVPAIIKTNLTEAEAEMYVIESNLMQRGFDNLKISEQAAVIAMRHNQMFSQGKRNDIIKELQMLENPEDETLSPMGKKSETTSEKLGAEYGMSKNSIARLLRIDKLHDGLKPLVDDGTIPVRAAVNISYLDEDVQYMLIKFAKIYKLDIKKSEQLREYLKLQELDQCTVIKILTGRINNKPKLPKAKTIKISRNTYSRFFNDDLKAAILKPIFIIVGGIFYVAFYLLSLIFFKENEFMNEVINSITMIYNEKDKIYVPKWKFDVKTMSISLFRERNCEYRTITIINKYCYDHLKYLYQNDQDRIQQLLNDEKLYWYICRKDKDAKRIVDRQH
ncbi:MAG: ParB N-terminal domain-containing protein [Ruminococcus sp.]|nr:ParB N-terminal domain-containing protein [Ruminococcus sp.]